MRKSKLFLGAFVVLAGVFTACANEEMLETPSVNDELKGRAQINLTIGNPVETRFSAGTGFGSNMSVTDEVGAVLVDAGYDAGAWGNVSWTVVDSHVGNNKWTYSDDAKRFTTCGTTAVGQWLFYAKYRESVTTDRSAIKFDFPQIQEAAADLRWLENNNYNLKVSPIINIDGIEGDKMDLEVGMRSVMSYAELKFKFEEAVTKVNKVVVTAHEVGGGNPFAKAYAVNNTKLVSLGAVANTSIDENAPVALKVQDYDVPANGLDLNDQNESIERAGEKILEKDINWDAAITSAALISKAPGAAVYDYLVLDCEASHDHSATNSGMALVDGEFTAYMLLPMGMYQDITLTVYTDKGAYTKTLNTRNEYTNNVLSFGTAAQIADAPADKGTNEMYLRAHTVTNLANIEKVAKIGDKINVADFDYIYFAISDKDDEEIITKTSDLINYINGVTAVGEYDVNILSQDAFGGTTENDDAVIPEHKMVLNAAVMAALEAKEEELDGEVHLNFIGAPVEIQGNADDYLKLHNLTFNEGANVVSGKVNFDTDIIAPMTGKITVKAGVLCKYNNERNAGVPTQRIQNLVIEENAKVYTYKDARIDKIANNGTFVVNTGSLTSVQLINVGNVTVKSTLKTDGTLENSGSIKNQGNLLPTNFVNHDNGTVTNNAELTLKNAQIEGIVNNNANILVTEAVNVKLDAVVTNAAGATIDVKGTTAASLNIAVGAEVVNSGNIYASLGNNTIHNLGVITSKTGARTVITTNSSAVEANTKDVTMGRLVLEDPISPTVSVSTENRQGYIEYTISGVYTPNAKDKFNKAIFADDVTLGADGLGSNVRFVVANGDIDFSAVTAETKIQEMTFAANSVVYSPSNGAKLIFGYLTLAKDVFVDVPKNNGFEVAQVLNAGVSATNPGVHNEGTLFVSGKVNMGISAAAATGNGEYKSGDGNSTAIVWM